MASLLSCHALQVGHAIAWVPVQRHECSQAPAQAAPHERAHNRARPAPDAGQEVAYGLVHNVLIIEGWLAVGRQRLVGDRIQNLQAHQGPAARCGCGAPEAAGGKPRAGRSRASLRCPLERSARTFRASGLAVSLAATSATHCWCESVTSPRSLAEHPFPWPASQPVGAARGARSAEDSARRNAAGFPAGAPEAFSRPPVQAGSSYGMQLLLRAHPPKKWTLCFAEYQRACVAALVRPVACKGVQKAHQPQRTKPAVRRHRQHWR